MKTIVLAAGYGTRLQTAIGDFPKALVDVGGKTVLDRLMKKLLAVQQPADITLVSNSRYLSHFESWLTACGEADITLLDDGSTDAENRRGAIGDIAFALERTGIDDDLLIVASDSLMTFDFSSLMSAFEARPSTYVGVWFNPDLADQAHRGVVELGEDDVITTFVEKPASPRSHWSAAPFYLLPRPLVSFVDRYLATGGNPDAPGHLMEALVREHELRAWHLPGDVIDIGHPETLALARRRFEARSTPE